METTDFDGPVTITDGGDTSGEAPALPRGTAVSRYIVADLIGQGGMGMVYKAFDPVLNRPVALKLLSVPRSGPKAGEGQRSAEQSSQDFAGHKTRLLREAQALAQLSHPNVVTVHDVGTHQDAVFMAMEFVEGKDLRTLLEERALPGPALLEILKAAGRGLAAAHQAGIIHRDFKPGNVIIGNDGRVRVLDFGLARGAAADEPPARPAEEPDKWFDSSGNLPSSEGGLQGLLSSTLTQAGAIVGTPHYMAPEQHLGQPVDAKSDQFAFCVVLFEALFGQRPFSGRSLKEMVHKITQGQIDRPTRNAVPAWLDRITARGLSVDSAARYPSMEALLADLDNDPAIAQRLRRAKLLRWALVGLAGVFAALGAWGVWFGTTRGARRCRGGEGQLAGVWDEGVRVKIQAAFGKTGRPYAKDTVERVARVLDAYGRAWTAMRRDACEATHVRGEQSDLLLDLRMRCLERRLGALRALTELFATDVDPGVVDRAVEAALGLGSLRACADVEALTAAVPPPADPAARVKADLLRQRIEQARAQEKAGHYQQGYQIMTALAQEVEGQAYEQLRAEAWFTQGCLSSYTGDQANAVALLNRAIQAAALARDDTLRATATTELIFVTGYEQARTGEALAIGKLAQADVLRAGAPEEQQAVLLNNLAVVHSLAGDNQTAQDLMGRSIALAAKVFGPDHPRLASGLNNLGEIQLAQKQLDAARQNFLQAHRILEGALGPDHPNVAYPLYNLGQVHDQRGETQQAVDHYARALGLWEPALGREHPFLAQVLTNLARALWDSGGDRAQATGFALRAWELYKKDPSSAGTAARVEAEAWLREHEGKPR